ncbi:MAG TPA: FecR domain-containing protein [Burkholderiales bacterium]|nr:FecR domain-containing protein [Burkholderiales bacterium]
MARFGHAVRFIAAAAFAAICGPALGQPAAPAPDAAGRFMSVTGEVSIVGRDGARRVAQRDDSLREGDSIVTGTDALAQLRLRDGSLFSVRAETEAKLDEFRFTGREDRSASFAMSIVRGGFRTITGLIGQLNRSGYRISTPSATIGIRGTHFEAVHLPAPVQQVPAGTYNRVFEGITQMQNPAGNLVVSRNQTAFVGLGNVQPVIVAPPPAIFGRPTPVPRAAAPTGPERAADKAAPPSLGQDGVPGRRELAPGRLAPTDRAIAPIDSDGARTLDSTTIRLPSTTTLNPETVLQPSPTIAPTTTLERSTTTIQTIQSPTTTQILQSPTTTQILQSPTTTQILQSPTTTQILQSPTTTIQQPTTTTIQSPTKIQTSPTRTISPTITR